MSETARAPAPSPARAGWLVRLAEKLEPHERIAFVFVTATWLLFVAFGFRSSWLWVAQAYAGHLIFVSKGVLGMWLPLWLYRLWRKRTTFAGGALEVLAYLRGAAVLLAVTVAYTHLKARKLDLNPRLFDPWLIRLDDFLFAGGGDFIGWVASWNRSPVWTYRMEQIYALSALAMGVPLGIAFGLRGREVVRRAFGALVLIYGLGALLYVALPALGPAFVRAEAYAHLAGTRYHFAQDSMIRALRSMAASRDFPVIPWVGIAAFPSLHVGIAWLGVMVSWTYLRALVPLCVASVGVIAASALWFGWHYVIDFPPGILLAMFAWWAAGEMVGARDRETSAAPTPSPEAASALSGETPGQTVG